MLRISSLSLSDFIQFNHNFELGITVPNHTNLTRKGTFRPIKIAQQSKAKEMATSTISLPSSGPCLLIYFTLIMISQQNLQPYNSKAYNSNGTDKIS